MNRIVQIIINCFCCPVVAPLVWIVYAWQGRFSETGGWRLYFSGLVKYLKGEL